MRTTLLQFFDEIVSKSEQIINTMREIVEASQSQQNHMNKINEEISHISAAVTANAASSEQTAAVTQQMLGDARGIHSELKRFRLGGDVETAEYDDANSFSM